MATIYSYPRVENLTGDDVLLLSDSTEEQRTLSVSIGQVTDYVSGFIQLGNNPSAINFVSELQNYITIENNTLNISGYATDSSVNTVANSVVQLGIATTANLNAAIAALNTSLTADYTSYVGTQLTSYSTSAITTQEIATATADLASAPSVTELETQFVFTNGSITGTSGALSTEIAAASAGTSQAFATRVTNLEAMFTLNNANPQAPTGLSSANIQAIQTVIASDGYAFSSTVDTLQTEVNGNAASITTNATAISNETSARASAITNLQTDVDGNTASITTNTTAISNEESARISADQTLTTDVAGNTSLISTNATAISTETSTRASAIAALTSTVDGNTASITTNASTIADVDGNVSGSYGVTVDANGSIAGLQLLTDGSASSIKFAADQFKFTNGAGTLTPFSIDAVNSKINLTGDVVFTSSSIPAFDSDVQDYIDTVGEVFTSTTTISGGQITTGKIESVDYSNTSGDGFSEIGMAIDLDNDSIHAPQFSIESDGSANFKGTIELLYSHELYTTATSTVTVDQSILIEPNTGTIKLAFDNMPAEDLSLSNATGIPSNGELILDSLGISIDTAAIASPGGEWASNTDGISNNGILADVRALKADNISLNFDGQRWITGAYFKATNQATSYASYETPTASYGAVIERARLDGVIPQALTLPAGTSSSNPRAIPSSYACYINKSTSNATSFVKLPNDARIYQQIDVTTLYSGHSTRVYSGCTAGTQNRPGEHGDHRVYDANADKIYYNGWNTYITVDQRQTERFIWMGTYWKRIVWDQ